MIGFEISVFTRGKMLILMLFGQALEPSNCPAWERVEGTALTPTNLPLYVKHLPISPADWNSQVAMQNL